MYATHKAGRNEFEVLIVGMCLALGGLQVFQEEVPATIADTSSTFQEVWAWSMLIGAAVALTGIALRDAYTGLVLELTGLTALGGVTAGFSGIVILTSANATNLVAVPTTLAFACACVWRCVKIIRKIFRKKERRQSMLNEIIERKAITAVRNGETPDVPTEDVLPLIAAEIAEEKLSAKTEDGAP